MCYFRGYFAKEPNQTQTKYVHTYSDLLKYLTNDMYDVKSYALVGPDMAMVEYLMSKPQTDRTGSAVMASWTTSLARVKLYEGFEKSGMPADALLYMVGF